MLHDEYLKYQDQIVRSSRKENRKKFGHFNEIQFTSKDWLMIGELNEELRVRHCISLTIVVFHTDSLYQPFNRLTKSMEGDGPTGAFVLPNYYQTISNLKKKEAGCSRGHPFHPMYIKMIEKLEIYQEEALKCETLVIATILHPTF
jgi:hypothetical protein